MSTTPPGTIMSIHRVVRDAEILMEETMSKFQDPSHDKLHVYRVRKTAMSIASRMNHSNHPSTRKVDHLVVELAALFHDVLDKKYVSAEQAADPYAYFLPWFEAQAEKNGLDLVADGRGKEITKIIEHVSWSTEKKLRAAGEWSTWHDECLELHCVQDADRLDAIGAFGILRCAAYTAATKQALYTSSGDPAYATSAIAHFHDKLVHIKDRLKTKPGLAAGEKRHQFLLDFIHALEEEDIFPLK